MLNFRSYPNLTRVVIPNKVQLSNNSISYAFDSMINLVTVDFNHSNINNMHGTY